MTSGFDRAQQAYDANTEPPEPQLCAPEDHSILTRDIEVIDHDTLQIQCADCGGGATFTLMGDWEL